MAVAAQKKLVIDVAKTIDHFDSQTGWDCKQWLMTMEHTCNNVDFTEDQLLGVFKFLSLIKDTRPWRIPLRLQKYGFGISNSTYTYKEKRQTLPFLSHLKLSINSLRLKRSIFSLINLI